MMKNNAVLRGSGAGLAAIIQVNTTVGFLAHRQQGIDLSLSKTSDPSGYVWRRVFLRGKRRRD